MKRNASLEDQLQEAATLGLERIKEFLKADRGMGSEAWSRINDQAKVGSFAVGSFVRHEAAMNNREALELKGARQLTFRKTGTE